MSPKDLKRALLLYKRYKTDGREYRELAQKYGMNTTDLNQLCWKHTHPKRA